MEKDKNISALLGMRQEDMVLLLRVNKSQWAMYETGKRDLPLEAQLKLVEMLPFIQQPTNASEDSFLDVAGQKVKTEKGIERLKLINQHRQLLTERKLQLTERKYEEAVIALRFVRFLKTNLQQMATEHHSHLGTIQKRAQEALEKNGLHVQAKYRIKGLALQEEEKVLRGWGSGA